MISKIFSPKNVVCFSLIISGAMAGQNHSMTTSGTAAPVKWVSVDKADWSVYMDAPAYHFALAKQYFIKGNYTNASAELSSGREFLMFEKDRLSSALREIDDLSKKVSNGSEKDTLQFDSVTSHALNVISYKYTIIPMEVQGSAMFGKAHTYHFEKAKLKLQENERVTTADEIRKSAAFLRLKAAAMGITRSSAVDSAGMTLQRLAMKVESGTVKDVKELDEAFKLATLIFSKKKE